MAILTYQDAVPQRALWRDPAALLHIDREHSRYFYDGELRDSEAACQAAMGRSALAESLGAFSGDVLTGEADIYASNFASGIDTWATQSGSGSVAQSGAYLRITTTGTHRAAKAVTVANAVRRAVRTIATMVATSGVNAKTMSVSESSAFTSNFSEVSSTFGVSPPEIKTVLGPSAPTSVNISLANGSTGTWDFSSVVAKWVWPYLGYVDGQLAAEIVLTTPASYATTKVALAWSLASAKYRLRVETDTSGHIVVRVSRASTDVAVLDLGAVAAGSRHTVRLSAVLNAFHANLDGGPIVSDLSGDMPPPALFFIGRSQAGETWDGTIYSVKVYANAHANANVMIDPRLGFRIFGDSTADGTGAAVDWYETLTAAYTPDRAFAKNSAGGEGSTQLLARVAADADFYRDWTTIFMDRPNTGETSATCIANLKAAVAYLRTDRWLVMPPVQDYPSTNITSIAEVQALLLSDAFFAGHTFDAVAQAAYLAELNHADTRSDGLHFDDSGQVIQATHIKAWLDAKGW